MDEFFAEIPGFSLGFGMFVCKDVGWKPLQVEQTFFPRQSFFICPYLRHPKQRPLDLTNSILSVCNIFLNLSHSFRLWVFLHKRHLSGCFLSPLFPLLTSSGPVARLFAPNGSLFRLLLLRRLHLLYLFLSSCHCYRIAGNSSFTFQEVTESRERGVGRLSGC